MRLQSVLPSARVSRIGDNKYSKLRTQMKKLTVRKYFLINLRHSKKMLIIEGHILTKVLSDQELEETFFAVAKDAPSVCICRCSPTQKAIVASKL